MPAPLARALLLFLATATLAVAAWMFWTQSGVYPVTHAALYACSLAPLVVAVISLVAMFAPFDSPASAPRWGAALSGLALGLTAGGLVMYTATFVWLGPVLIAYAALVGASATGVARGSAPKPIAPPAPPPAPPVEQAATQAMPPSDPPRKRKKKGSISDDTTKALPVEPSPVVAPPVVAPPPGVGTVGRNVLLVLSALWGIGLCWAWQPPPGKAHPSPLGVDVASVLSSAAPHLNPKRVLRRADHIEITGSNRCSVKVYLERPRIEVMLRQQRFVIDPTLSVEEGTVDGFFSFPTFNGYRAEVWGPAEVVELAESGRRSGIGTSLGYARVRYPAMQVGHMGPFAPLLGSWGRPPADALSARVDVGMDLEDGIITIDAITEVPRALTVRRTVLGAVQVPDAKGAKLRVDLGGPLELTPAAGRPGTTLAPAELLVTDGRVVRALRSRRRDAGPYETIDVGSFDAWMTIEGLRDRFLLVMPDWTTQASVAPSRTAGHGLPENALVYWSDAGALNVAMDVAGTRVGPGRLSAELPPGIYRHRLRLMALPAQEPDIARRGREQRDTLLDPSLRRRP